MPRTVYRFSFQPKVPMQDVASSLFIAALAAEGLHGRAQVRLDADYELCPKHKVAFIDAGTRVGRSIAKVFTGLVLAEFGEDQVRVARVVERSAARPWRARRDGARR